MRNKVVKCKVSPAHGLDKAKPYILYIKKAACKQAAFRDKIFTCYLLLPKIRIIDINKLINVV
jgi:hypothetical protein